MRGSPAADNSFQCPTCNARQPASTTECRRCRCDLSLVLAIRDSLGELHARCLKSLASGHAAQALNCAQRRYELSPDDTSRRLVAVALLCLGRYEEAMEAQSGTQ